MGGFLKRKNCLFGELWGDFPGSGGEIGREKIVSCRDILREPVLMDRDEKTA